jgi:FkbM family methyltransferase
MATSNPRFANAFLRYVAPSFSLRKVPLLGSLLRLTGRSLLPSDTLTWLQIERGRAAGLWIRVNPRTQKSILLAQGEPRVQQAIEVYLRSGMTFYDLGANIGFFSLLAARLVGPEGRVIAFEADSVIAARLRENLARNRFLHAAVEEKAVWSESSTVSFACADATRSADRGLGYVTANHDEAANTIRVESVSLDDYCLSHSPPDFIKCDVEGAEDEVFRGAAKTLRHWHPTIVCEMHNMDNQFALLRYFRELGYSCRLIDQNHVLAYLA